MKPQKGTTETYRNLLYKFEKLKNARLTGISTTDGGFTKYYSLLHGRNLFFLTLNECLKSMKETKAMEAKFANPTKKDLPEMRKFMQDNGLVITIEFTLDLFKDERKKSKKGN